MNVPSNTSIENPRGLTRSAWLRVISSYVRPDIEVGRRSSYHRKHRRYEVAFAFARVLSMGGAHPEGRECPLFQISLGGLQMKTHERIPVGTWVQLEAVLHGQAFPLSGEVVHSTEVTGGYKTGIRLHFADEALRSNTPVEDRQFNLSFHPHK